MNIEFLQELEPERGDSLSLLGMPPATLAKYHKKGITTITQLSHLFRPRRRSRALAIKGRYLYEMKALAIREQKTYVLHKPEIPATAVSIYLDMEGVPDENFIYLIGGIITQADLADQTFSFWANSQTEQQQIFDQLKAIFFDVSRGDDLSLRQLRKQGLQEKWLFHGRGAARQPARLSAHPCLSTDLYQRPEGTGKIRRLYVDRSGSDRPKKHRLAKKLGTDAGRSLEGATDPV